MINQDIRHIVESALQPGETLLWASKSQNPKLDIVEFGFSLFWSVFCALGLVLVVHRIFSEGLGGAKILYLLAAPILVWVIVEILRSMFKRNDASLIAAISDKRLIILSLDGKDRSSYGNMVFDRVDRESGSNAETLTLVGYREGDEEVLVQLNGVKDAATAEQILVTNFLRSKASQS